MGEILIDCPFCGMEIRNSAYKTHICLGDKIDDLQQLTDYLLELMPDDETDS